MLSFVIPSTGAGTRCFRRSASVKANVTTCPTVFSPHTTPPFRIETQEFTNSTSHLSRSGGPIHELTPDLYGARTAQNEQNSAGSSESLRTAGTAQNGHVVLPDRNVENARGCPHNLPAPPWRERVLLCHPRCGGKNKTAATEVQKNIPSPSSLSRLGQLGQPIWKRPIKDGSFFQFSSPCLAIAPTTTK